MNKIKLFINDCKCEINSLLDRIRGKEINHIIITTNGDKIKCYESVELYDDEIKIICVKCLIGLKQRIITITDDKIDYLIENYNDDVWNQVKNIINIDDSISEKNYDYDIYG